MPKDLAICPILDVYLPIFSPKQQEVLKSYYYDDLSLSEIAENLDMSKPGVRDILKRCEKKFGYLEDKLGFLNKIKAFKKLIKDLECELDKIDLGYKEVGKIEQSKLILKEIENVF